MHSSRRASLEAFTLIELSIVVLVLGLLVAAAMRYVNSTSDGNMIAATNATLDVIDAAMQNYRNAFGVVPCPADITAAENTSTFGTQVDTLADGNCTGYNYINSSADPDSGDPNYDSATLSQVVEGGVPTKTLKIDDKYAYDAWGNKIFYAVDKRYTAYLAFTNTYTTSSKVGAVVVFKTSTDTLANALSSTLVGTLSYNAIYALVSTGENRHGGFARNLGNTAVRFNAGSTNTDELKNCHCSNAAAATNFDRYFVQKTKTFDSTSFSDNFDDIVRFKTRSDMSNYSELQ